MRLNNKLVNWIISVLSVISLSFIIGCGGGGGAGSSNPEPIPPSLQLEPPTTKTVNGMLNIPSNQENQSLVVLSTLKVQSFVGTANIDSFGNFYNLPVVNEDGGQVVFVLNDDNDAMMAAYISKESVSTGMITIGAREMALGIILFNPYISILPEDQKIAVINQAENHNDFDNLVRNIEYALIHSPENALDYESFPCIYNTAMAIGLEILESYGDNILVSGENYGVFASVGPDELPHLKDPAGSYVTFVNPKMVFYGIKIAPSPASETDDMLLRGRGSLVSMQLGWPPVVTTPPHEHDFNLGEGAFTITFYKGLDSSVNDWLDPLTAPGKATYANFLKCVGIVLDVFNLQWYVKLNDTTIFHLVSAVDPPSLYFDASFRDALSTVNWIKILEGTTRYLIENWDDIAYWVYQEWSGDSTVLALQSTLKVISGVANAIPYAKILVLGAKATNQYIPFGYDLVTAPSILEYTVQQTGGTLSELSRSVPPTASFIFNPLQPSVGETVEFNASASYDDVDSAASLQVQWDFDGDGVWDTLWTTTKIATYVFSDRGSYKPILRIKDSDGKTGCNSHDIYVGSTEELKIVLTWGANPQDLDSHLWTPEIEGNTYHVYYMNKYYDLTNPPYVMLDLDDTSSYGPETIWFERVYPGTYTYAVYLFSGTGTLATSEASVRVIDRGGVIAAFNVPSSGSGRWWTVFTMNGATGHITSINTIGDTVILEGNAFVVPLEILK